MKNELPRVTAIYFISLIKAYLQGVKTKQEILTETSGILPGVASGEAAPVNVTNMLLIAASQINENFYFAIVEQISGSGDTTPTRAGLLHHLEAYVAGDITPEDLLEWAAIWQHEDEMTDVFFADPAVEYFCLFWLPAARSRLSITTIRQVLAIFRLNCGSPLKEKIALVLLSDKEKQHFLFFLRDYADHRKTMEELDLYLLKKFGMDHQSFPYMADLSKVAHKQERLEVLLEKAALIKATY